MAKMEGYLERLYYTPNLSSSYAGVDALLRQVKKEGKFKLKRKDIVQWLKSQNTYTLHKPVRKKFVRNKTIVSGIDDQWQADLVDFSSLSKQNKGYRYLLTCIDILSKYAWVKPLLSKSSKCVTQAFQDILKEGRIPNTLQSDDGGEFKNHLFQGLLKEYGIHFFTTSSDTKSAVVERFNRTLKSRMWRYFTHKSTYKYIAILPDLVSSYNHSFHRSIQTRPVDVDKMNEMTIWKKLYQQPAEKVKFKFHIGDAVRISKVKRTFAKGYVPNWTEELFTIAKCIARSPPVYKLKDYGGEILEGSFYEHELQHVIKEDDVYKVKRIIKTRTRKGKKEHLVKWLGYKDAHNSWVSDIQTL